MGSLLSPSSHYRPWLTALAMTAQMRSGLRAARSEEFLDRRSPERRPGPSHRSGGNPSKSYSEANLLNADAFSQHNFDQFRQSRQHKQSPGGGALSYRHDAPILNDKYFPKAAYGSMAITAASL